MKGYRLSQDAARDLDEIAEYISVQTSVERAMRVWSDLRKGCRELAEMPTMGHFRDDVLSRKYRFWTVDSYVIVYRWEGDPIKVVAIVHGARDLDAFFHRRPTE
jgi:toxin ParE1/3/4